MNILPLLSVNFIGTLGYSIVTPFLVFIVTRFGGNEFIYGIMGATYSFFQLFGAPILGKYSDSVGRKKVLFLSQAGTLFAWLIFLVALLIPLKELATINSSLLGEFTLTIPLLILFLARALDGLTGGNISVANAYLADISKKEELSGNFGKMAASTNLGFIIGPLLAGVLGATVYKEILPVSAAAIISVIGLLLILKLSEVKPKKLDKAPCKNPNRRLTGKEIKDCFDQEPKNNVLSKVSAIPNFRVMLLIYFLLFLGFNIFYTAFPLHAISALEWELAEMGIFFSILSALMIVIQGPVMSRLSKKVSEEILVSFGSTLILASFLAFYFTSNVGVYLGAVFFAVGNGTMWPSFMSLLSKLGNSSDQGFIQGISTSSGSLASIVGLIFGGLLYNWIGPVTFWVGSSFFGIVFLISMKWHFRGPSVAK